MVVIRENEMCTSKFWWWVVVNFREYYAVHVARCLHAAAAAASSGTGVSGGTPLQAVVVDVRVLGAIVETHLLFKPPSKRSYVET